MAFGLSLRDRNSGRVRHGPHHGADSQSSDGYHAASIPQNTLESFPVLAGRFSSKHCIELVDVPDPTLEKRVQGDS